ncbi:MAG: hypothetical protein M1829_000652 [Trizodia sp. TS-e1964]|nr:MAG: hypothetical protein M1829_000652 [Trizodia sp. TS-e1964]
MLEQMCSSSQADLCKQILAIVTIAHRPIEFKELALFVDGLKDISDDPQLMREAIGYCGSFLTLREHTIYFVHQSMKDFLVEKASDTIFPFGREVVNYAILSKSLKAMSRVLRHNHYSLQPPGICIDQVEHPSLNPLVAVRYSCVYWVDHLCELGSSINKKHKIILQDGGAVDEFLRRKYLFWLEALSLFGSILEGVQSMTRLQILIQEKESASRLINLVQDARRFILFNKSAIENNPLQVYTSALIFSPTCSLIRELFKKEEPEWIINKPAMQEYWSSCLQTLEGHSNGVYSVAFSHNDKQLASASDDKTLKIWDTASGSCLQTLEGHGNWVNSVAFSHDDKQLASASDDKTLKIWDTASGSCLQTLEGHSKGVNSVAFSHDDKQLASASYDKTLKIWDTASGSCLHTLEGHRNVVYSVAFSHDDKQLASASYDKTLKIWDTASGSCLQKLEGHGNWVNSVTFSHDDKQLASASSDGTLKIWDTASGSCLQTLGVGKILHNIFFDTTDQYLHTEIGAIAMDLHLTSSTTPIRSGNQKPSRHGYGISFDHKWITYKSENFLWLPLEYRPICSAVTGSTVAIGCYSGRVLIFNFMDPSLLFH